MKLYLRAGSGPQKNIIFENVLEKIHFWQSDGTYKVKAYIKRKCDMVFWIGWSKFESS